MRFNKKNVNEANNAIVIKQRNFISIAFCLAFIGLVITFAIIITKSSSSYSKFQKSIIDTHQQHLAKIENYANDFQLDFIENKNNVEKRVLIVVDSISKLNLKSQKQIQSALHKELSTLIELHSISDDDLLTVFDLAMSNMLSEQERLNYHLQLQLDKVGQGYSIIEIWAAILSVLFLTFGFYAIFKIEESKKEASDYLEGVKKMCENQIQSVTTQSESIRIALDESNTRLSNIESINLNVKTKIQELESLKKEAYKIIEETKSEKQNLQARNRALKDDIRKEFNSIIDNIINQYNGLDSVVKDTLNKINNISNG